MKLRRSLYSRPKIVRGQQCAEAPLDPSGATEQLPARAYLALEGGLTAEPAWAVERPQAPSTGTRLGVPACGGSAWRPRRSGCRPRRRHPVRVLGQRPVSGVRCPVSGVRCERPVSRLPVPATGVQCPVPSERPGVRCPASAVGVRCLCVAASAVSGRSEVLERGVGRQPMAGMAGVGVVARCVHDRLVVCLSRRLALEAGAAAAGPAEASVWTWPSSSGGGWAVPARPRGRPG
jgi:hypothetical protein